MSGPQDAAAWIAGDGSILRMSGFALTCLERWIPWRVGGAIEDYVAALRAVDDLRERILGELAGLRLGDADISKLRRLEGRILRVKPVRDEPEEAVDGLAEWNETLERWHRAEAGVARGIERQAEEVEEALRALVHGDEAYRLAVFVNSPSALAALDGSGKLGRRLRQLAASYAQAFTGKCETTAVAGPTNRVHHVEAAAAPGLSVRRGRPGAAAKTRSRLSYWAALECLGALLERHPEHVLPRRSARPAAGEPAPGDRDLLAACDGTRTVAALRARFGPAVDGRLEALQAAGQVSLEPWLTPFVEDPGKALLELAAAMGDAPAARVRPVVEAAGALATHASVAERRQELSRLEESLADVTGRGVRRRGGGFYVDRFAYNEEGWGNLEGARIGGGFLRTVMRRLTGALDFVASEAIETLLHERAAGAGRAQSREEVRADRDRRLEEAFGASLSRGEALDLDSGELRRLGLIRPDLADWPLLGSADLMFGGRPEELAEGRTSRLVVSEVHHILPVLSIPLAGLAGIEVEEGGRILRQLLRAGAIDRLAIPRTDRPHKAMDAVPAGDAAQLNVDWTEPNPHGAETLDLGALGEEWRQSRWLYPPYDEYDIDPGLMRRHALPAIDKGTLLSSRDRTPRILIDGVVFQRASWRLRHADFERAPRRSRSVAESVVAVNRARAKHGIPRRFFARIGSDEAKPMLVDAHLPELCDALMARVSRPGGPGRVLVTEMLPAAGELWLETSQGRHCSELRITVVRPGRASR